MQTYLLVERPVTDTHALFVVAKGRNLLADEIREIARWNDIPIVENKPLAHLLYRSVEIGGSVPPKLYAVVAEVLAAIYRAQARALNRTVNPVVNAEVRR